MTHKFVSQKTPYRFIKWRAKFGQNQVRDLHLTKTAIVWCNGKELKGSLKYTNINGLQASVYSTRTSIFPNGVDWGFNFISISLKREERNRRSLVIYACGPNGYGIDKLTKNFRCNGSLTLEKGLQRTL